MVLSQIPYTLFLFFVHLGGSGFMNSVDDFLGVPGVQSREKILCPYPQILLAVRKITLAKVQNTQANRNRLKMALLCSCFIFDAFECR